MTWTNEELQELLQEVSRKATVDEGFRTLAITDPTAAMSQINPKPLPPDINFKFVDNSGLSKIIPLPDPTFDIEELPEMELENVAGGDVSVSGGWGKKKKGT